MSASSVTAFTIQFNQITTISIVTFGCIGNIVNILVFTRRRLMKNPCSTHFLCSSIGNLNVLIFGLVSRFLSDDLVFHLGLLYFHVCPLTTNNNTNVSQLRKRDQQLIKMMFAQFIFIIAVTTPIAVQKVHATFTQHVINCSFQSAVQDFLAQLMRMLVFINCSTNFYV
ncbi:unnamed protein product [Rotaria sp. Silwood1]|nr:unnamed protein product [Rotaria sp. Silwood1]CAF3434038.1 unnamed protein product [Rotaria sp. Silwood1]CAF4850892.1 unnamed protein product [Rotaria sp. Silwood1]